MLAAHPVAVKTDARPKPSGLATRAPRASTSSVSPERPAIAGQRSAERPNAVDADAPILPDVDRDLAARERVIPRQFVAHTRHR
jgi:hypothetical protein